MKSIIKKIVIILITSVLMLYFNVSIISNATNEISDYQNKIQQNNKEEKEIEQKKKEISKIKDETLKQVETLNLEISEYEKQIENLNGQIDVTNKKITETTQKLNKTQEDYNKQEKLLEERLIAIYETGETTYLDFLLSSESLTDLISNYYLASEIANYDTELLDKIEKQKKEIEQAKQTLEQSKTELNNQKVSKQSVSGKLQVSKNEKSNYVSQLSETEKELEAKLEQIKKDNQSLDAKIKRKQAEIEAAKKLANKNNSGTSSGASSSTSSVGFIKPVNSYITTKLYYSSGRYHGAVDYGAGNVNGMPVYAVADGYVVSVERWTTSYGNHILIAHYNGLYTLYAHGQSGSICVSEGQTVKRGQQIMRVGSTGNSTGPHLHFEVRRSPGTYSCRVNPMEYIPN